jgi:hypothetical protein
MLRPDPDTFAEAGSAAEWDEMGEFRHLDSNQDKQSQSLLGCQLPHAGRRRIEGRRSDALPPRYRATSGRSCACSRKRDAYRLGLAPTEQ